MSTTETKPRFSFKAPPPAVVLLPDAQFFTRVVPVAEAATAADVAAQVELALEALAPFPLAQMYYGHFWKTGAANALVFAAYRKRFTAEQTEAWHDAEAVMPAFAATLSAKVTRATTLLLTADDSVTAVHWANASDVPSAVVTRPIPPDATDAQRAAVRDDVLRSAGESVTVEDAGGLPVPDPESDDGELAFKAGKWAMSFSREELDALDVRDKEDLAARRRARSRDLLLWRIFLGSAAAIGFALLLEVAVIGGKFWQKGRMDVVAQRAPVVAEIQKANELATTIEDLSTNRLLPFEMIDLVKAHRPDSVVFTRITTMADSLYTLDIWGQAGISNDVVAYQSALNGLPVCQGVEVVEQRTVSGRTTFRFKITFKPEALKEEVAS